MAAYSHSTPDHATDPYFDQYQYGSSTSNDNEITDRVPIPMPGERLLDDSYEMPPDFNNARNLEEELAIADDLDITEAFPSSHIETDTSDTKAHGDHHCLNHQAKEYLKVFYEDLIVLAREPGTAKNKAAILEQIDFFYAWIKDDVIPYVDQIQDGSRTLGEFYKDAERDNRELRSEMEELRTRNEELRELYVRERDVSQEKSLVIEEMKKRCDEMFANAKSALFHLEPPKRNHGHGQVDGLGRMDVDERSG